MSEAEAAGQTNPEFEVGGENIARSGGGNYAILDVEGKGRYVECTINIHDLRDTNLWNWYGTGEILSRYGSNHIHAIPGDYIEELKALCAILDVDYDGAGYVSGYVSGSVSGSVR